jgi:hypothetical protein
MNAAIADEAAVRVPAKRGLAWWFAPDFALVVALVSLVYVLVIYDGTQQLLRDSDAGWHIRTGESILDGKGLPHADPYSLLRSGEAWFAWEWGADVIMGSLHRLGGMAAVTGFFAAVIAAVVWSWFRLNTLIGGHVLIAAALTPLLLMMTQIHWHGRPHMLSWLFLVAAVYYAESRWRNLWVVGIASALWVNVHASFFFGAVIAIIYVIGHLLRPILWQGECRQSQWREARWFAVAAAVSAAATLANPYGWSVHLHVFRYLANSEMLAHIGEFQSYNYFAGGALPVMVGVFVAAIGAVLAFTQRKLEHAMLAALLLAVGVRSGRGLPIVGLLCLPLANRAITEAMRRAPGLHLRLRRHVDDFLQYGENLVRIDSRFAGPATAVLILVVLAFALRLPEVANRAGFSPKEFPVVAADYLDRLPRNLRLLAPDVYGGYVIYRYNGEIKVYFDGRSDFYGAVYLRDYIDLMDLKAGWRERVEKVGFTHAMLPKDYSLISGLELIGWKRLHSDGVAVILQAPERRLSKAVPLRPERKR